ncbi:fimbrial assembly protein [Jeongeupia sp. USM3]|nr:fimbrial assembly protein [Jeongeupia sp. USM3]
MVVFCAGSAMADGVPPLAGESEYQFDESLLVGKSVSPGTIARFNKANAVNPGEYQVDVYINEGFLSRKTIEFRADRQGEVRPCLSSDLLLAGGVLPDKIAAAAGECAPLGDLVAGAASRFDQGRLRLDLWVPQASMKRVARGAVARDDLNAGETMVFVNYDTNYYRSDAAGLSSDSLYLNLNSGVNLGAWRFRQQSSYNGTVSGGKRKGNWDAQQTYVQRAIPAWQSELKVGDSYTPGNFFSSLSFRGVQLATDERMVPDSLRGYAPTVRGIATTNAKVSVRQGGALIYQTTVAPGPFAIDDLYPTSLSGDLDVAVEEADGRISTYTVPFNALPESVRPGRSQWNVSAGRVRGIEGSDAYFGDATYQRGLTNALTANGGIRVSDHYLSATLGGVLATKLGAFGVNAIYSSSDDPVDGRQQGWQLSANYSHAIAPWGTTFSLAGYRYSTDGYRELADVLAVSSLGSNADWQSKTYRQRSQFTATMAQSLASYGQLYLSFSSSDYWDGRGRDTQYQLTYSKAYKSVSYNLSLSRQCMASLNGIGPEGGAMPSPGTAQSCGANQNMVMFSLSLPLGPGATSPVLSGSVSRQGGSQGETTLQTTLAGTAGETQDFSYAVNAAYDTAGNGVSGGASVQQRLPVATVGGSYSKGQGYSQWGASARGAVVAHAGGVTFGPYVNDTFALVEAKGAEGARVIGGMGAEVDRFGYALVPSLVPYRYNDVALDSKGMSGDAELTEGTRRTAPYAGAAVRLKFRTLEGSALLIRSHQASGDGLPLGASVLDAKGAVIGLVGQGSQIYARAAGDKGELLVKWGDGNGEQCKLPFDLSGQAKATKNPLFRLDAVCLPVPATASAARKEG